MAGRDPASQASAGKTEPRSSPEPGQIAPTEDGNPNRPNGTPSSMKPAASGGQRPSLRQGPRSAVNKRKENAKQAKLRELLLLERVAKLKVSPGPPPSKTDSDDIAMHMGGSQADQNSGPANDTTAHPQLPRPFPVHGTVSSSLIPDQRHPIISVADPNYGRLSPPRFDVAQGSHASRQNIANTPVNGAAPPQNHGTKTKHCLPAVLRPTQTHYLPPVARTLVGAIGPGVQGEGSLGAPMPHTSIQPSTAAEPIGSNREASVKVENSMAVNFGEPSDQAERPEEPESHSGPQILSRECQMRRFNPKFIQRENARGFWCDLHLPGGKIVSNDEPSPSQTAAKIECAKKAIPMVRELPLWCMDNVPRPSAGNPPRHKTESARDIPAMSNALVLRNGNNDNQMGVAATPSRGHYGDPTWPVRLDPREIKIRKMEETMGFLIPPVYRKSEVAAQAFLAGFQVARQYAESSPSPARSGRRSRSHRERSPIRAALEGPEAARPQTRATGRSDRRARSKSPSLEAGSTSAKTPTPSRHGRGDYYWPPSSRRPSDNYPAASGGVDHYHS